MSLPLQSDYWTDLAQFTNAFLNELNHINYHFQSASNVFEQLNNHNNLYSISPTDRIIFENPFRSNGLDTNVNNQSFRTNLDNWQVRYHQSIIDLQAQHNANVARLKSLYPNRDLH